MRIPLLGLPALLLAPGAASARDVWTVGPTGDFASLTQAIGLVGDGDQVFVEPGTYVECLSIAGKSIDFVAPDGPAQTTIRCADALSPYAVQITAGATVRLDGFTVVHGEGLGGVRVDSANTLLRSVVMDGMTSTSGGGCVDATNGAILLYDASLARCYGTQGGAVRAINSYLALVEVDITTADAASEGGAVYQNTGGNQITGLTIDGATAGGNGGGMYLGGGGVLRDVEISNSSGSYGGGIYSAAALTLVDATLVGNAANSPSFGGEGGGVYSQGTLTLHETEFRDNTAPYYGGAVSSYGAITVTASTFADNEAISGSGGAIMSWSVPVQTRSSTFERNHATGVGGALYVPSTWTSSGDTFVENTATSSGGAAYTSSARIRDSVFERNTGLSAGAVFSASVDPAAVEVQGARFAYNTATNNGGALQLGGALQSVYNCEFVGNQANLGGAIFVGASTLLDLYASRLSDNVATGASGHGGAIYFQRATSDINFGVQLQFCRFETNDASGHGGAVYVEGGRYYGFGNWWVGNQADLLGGALYAATAAQLYTDSSLFCANTATGDGGAVYGQAVPNASYFYYTVFQENQGARGGAYFEDGRAALDTSRTTIYGNTLAGNSSAQPGFEGLVANSPPQTPNTFPGRLNIELGVFQDNGTPTVPPLVPTAAIRSLNGAAQALRVYTSDFIGHNQTWQASGTVDNGSNNTSPGAGMPPVPLPPEQWSRDGNCWNDDLTGKWTFHDFTNGASLHTMLYTDQDGDLMTWANQDCEPFTAEVAEGFVEDPLQPFDEDCRLGHDFDADGDNAYEPSRYGADCVEGNASIHPWATDIVGNGEDEDCQAGDESDGDGDGSSPPEDCADSDPLIVFFMAEIFYDGVDRNCAPDDYDADADGYDSEAFGGPDCDDITDDFGPDVPDPPYDGVDQNCDDWSDYDADHDGHDASQFGGGDCNDTDPATSPSAIEIPYDGYDQNCDQWNDWDGDKDTFVPTAYNAFAGGQAPNLDDCDDTNPFTFPGAVEITDGEDNTCDGIDNPDPDFDGDGVLDNWEAHWGTGVDDIDSDDDGLSDGAEWGPDEQHPNDTDGDNIIDAHDFDSDADTLPDAFEGLVDHDADGAADFRDADDDNDGIPTVVETDGLGPTGAPDTDGDTIPDWIDDDSDDDGALDSAEGTGDPDADGIGAWRDNGADGEGTDPTPPRYGFGCGCTSIPASPIGPAWAFGAALLAVLRRRPRSQR